MNYFNSKDKALCCGCGACYSACPQACIEMKQDEEGFLFPVINKLNCIDCKLCEEVCPIGDDHYKEFYNEKQNICYAGMYNDSVVVLESSSGGAFTAIVNSYCDSNYVIFGAAFEDIFKAKHTYVNKKDDIVIFRKSKYLQSEIADCFIKAKDFLEADKKVLFTGTPCQIAGLRSFLGKDYENLLTIDFLCHGVPSQKVFNNYIKSKEHKKKIVKYSFRNKFAYDLYGISIIWRGGKKNNYHSNIDNYMRGFFNVLFNRVACSQCKFACSNRVSDVTIADFWGLTNTELNTVNGVSLVIFSTKKGMALKNNLGNYMFLEEHKLREAEKSNSTLKQQNTPHINRQAFFNDMKRGLNFDQNVNDKLGKVSFTSKLKLLVPYKVKQKIKALFMHKA